MVTIIENGFQRRRRVLMAQSPPCSYIYDQGQPIANTTTFSSHSTLEKQAT